MVDSTPSQLEPTVIVIFGITGDLAQRYLLPALYHLFKENLLHPKTEIIGLTRQDLTAEKLLDRVELCLNEADKTCDPAVLKMMHAKTRLLKFDPSVSDDYAMLGQQLNDLEEEQGTCLNRLFYLSIPPNIFSKVVTYMGQHKLPTTCQHNRAQVRLLVEKPFGSDLASAQILVETTKEVFQEEQVFRIDHYLAKEMAQNILVFRRYNPIFAAIWSNQHIEAIDIYSSEKIGIEGRVNFYEGLGAVRDLIQSHLLQLMAITTMDMPEELDSQNIHAQKHALLSAIKPANPDLAVRAQYASYKDEVKNPDSTTETYAQLQLFIDNERWRDVPITITTGKAMSAKRTDISITFADRAAANDAVNVLTLRIQPNEGIQLQLRAKKPSYSEDLEAAIMDFSYQNTFGDTAHPTAYERVLVDAVKGDRTLFASSDEVLESWRILQPVLNAWSASNSGLQTYPNGTNGPQA